MPEVITSKECPNIDMDSKPHGRERHRQSSVHALTIGSCRSLTFYIKTEFQ